VDQDQGTRLSALRERVLCGEYQVDPRAVAEAIVRRLGQWARTAGPSDRVFVPRQVVPGITEEDSRRTL
jgi:hypothetical protein